MGSIPGTPPNKTGVLPHLSNRTPAKQTHTGRTRPRGREGRGPKFSRTSRTNRTVSDTGRLQLHSMQQLTGPGGPMNRSARSPSLLDLAHRAAGLRIHAGSCRNFLQAGATPYPDSQNSFSAARTKPPFAYMCVIFKPVSGKHAYPVPLVM